MSIICGVDFSEPSLRALRAAAELAAHMQLPLHVVHAVRLRAERVGDESEAEVVAWAERRLRTEVDGLRAIKSHIEVHCAVGDGDRVLLATAERVAARLIIVAALGHRDAGARQLGSQADRVAQWAPVPVLVVRAPEKFEAWVHKVRPLHILLGVDVSPSSEAALTFVHELAKFGPCEITAAHLYWPPHEFQRLGLMGVRSLIDPEPEVTHALEGEIRAQLTRQLPSTKTQVILEPHLGRVGDRLAAIALERHADLIVVGSHHRDPMDRVLHGSVSRGVLHCAEVSVACVPGQASASSESLPQLRSVLAATDFSPSANVAIPLAYSLVARGGTVHLVHVVQSTAHNVIEPRDIFKSGTNSPEHAAALAQLRSLVPKQAVHRMVITKLHILESNDAATALAQAAERLAVSALCLGTHGRSGLAKAVLGSVAQAVLSHTHRPVMLARLPSE